ncbi:MAG: pyridoxal 5'-phosphate synthase [Alphaproteobacteria bacterium GM7ARS4]|nr:pyridoxal 5'-phosphate synthase [Alphaproteobacteria bacterium GM7ARS4]
MGGESLAFLMSQPPPHKGYKEGEGGRHPYGMGKDDDPYALFRSWYEEWCHVCRDDGQEENLCGLGTVDRRGLPQVRMVLLKGYGVHGFDIYTDGMSEKSMALRHHGHGALCFYWQAHGRQVRVEGSVSLVPSKEADDYFASRPRASQIGAWSSLQSRPLDNESSLRQRVHHYERHFTGQNVTRPPYHVSMGCGGWIGWRLTPLTIEFWRQGEARLHERCLYIRPTPHHPWHHQFLYP